MKTTFASAGQFGFEGLLADADQADERRIFDRKTAHLPGTCKTGLTYYRKLIGAQAWRKFFANYRNYSLPPKTGYAGASHMRHVIDPLSIPI